MIAHLRALRLQIARRVSHEWRGDCGSAVAEFAVAMPAVLLVLAIVLGGVQLGALQLRLQDAAADTARSLGRGDTASAAERIAHVGGPVQWGSSRVDGLVCVHLETEAQPPVGLLGLRAVAGSCAWDET